MFTWIKTLPPPIRFLAIGFALILILSIGVVLFGQMRACGYDKARRAFETEKTAWATERSQIIGQIRERDKQIAELEIEKQLTKTLAEQGIKMDQEKAKQIDAISAKEATDLETIRSDMDCRTRAAGTVALLRTAKPPIILDLAATIRKQCGP